MRYTFADIEKIYYYEGRDADFMYHREFKIESIEVLSENKWRITRPNSDLYNFRFIGQEPDPDDEKKIMEIDPQHIKSVTCQGDSLDNHKLFVVDGKIIPLQFRGISTSGTVVLEDAEGLPYTDFECHLSDLLRREFETFCKAHPKAQIDPRPIPVASFCEDFEIPSYFAEQYFLEGHISLSIYPTDSVETICFSYDANSMRIVRRFSAEEFYELRDLELFFDRFINTLDCFYCQRHLLNL